MKLCFSTLGCPDWSLREIASFAARCGYDGVELRISNEKNGERHVDPDMNGARRKEVRELFAQNRVAIASLAGYTRFNSSDHDFLKENRRQLRRNFELACDLGAPLVRTFLGDGFPETDFQVQAECLHECGNDARALGATLVIETHDSIRTGAQLRRILNAVDSPNVAALWDIFHTLNAGEEPMDTVKELGSAIKHTHFKDGIGHQLKLVGEGELPIAACVDALLKADYRGYFSLEWEKMWHPELADPEIAFPVYARFMRDLKRKMM